MVQGNGELQFDEVERGEEGREEAAFANLDVKQLADDVANSEALHFHTILLVVDT